MSFETADCSAPHDEQAICITCGYCCDGTLFRHAILAPGEAGSGRLPAAIEAAGFSMEGKDWFRHPCHYFSGKCTIYDRQRAAVCGSFRCRLLRDYAEGRISSGEAVRTISQARLMLGEIIAGYRSLSGNDAPVNFRQVLLELGKELKPAENSLGSAHYDILIAKCNIFEALLLKHFRSDGEFDKLLMK